MVANLGRDEKEHGLTYVAMSRVTGFKLFGITGGLTSLDRLTNKILEQKRMAQRKRGEKKLDWCIGKACLNRHKKRLLRRGRNGN